MDSDRTRGTVFSGGIFLDGHATVRLSLIKPLLQTTAFSALALGCMFYPFMPGTYDRMAVTISGMVQMLGVGGLLLVPIGVLWLIYDRANVRRACSKAVELTGLEELRIIPVQVEPACHSELY